MTGDDERKANERARECVGERRSARGTSSVTELGQCGPQVLRRCDLVGAEGEGDRCPYLNKKHSFPLLNHRREPAKRYPTAHSPCWSRNVRVSCARRQNEKQKYEEGMAGGTGHGESQ